MNRHDRKELIDCPAVGERLENAEIAEVAVDQPPLQLLDDVLVLLRVLRSYAGNLVERRRIQLIGNCTSAQGQHAAVEQVLRLLLGEGGVVIDLPNAALRQIVVAFAQLVQYRVVVLAQCGQLDALLRLHIDHVDEQQRVVRGQCPPRFRDQMRHRELELAA